MRLRDEPGCSQVRGCDCPSNYVSPLRIRNRVKIDDGFDPDDPYQSVALIFAGILCDQCGEYCSGNPDGSVGNQEVPCRIMAEVARSAGWLVEARDPVRYEYAVLCPKCRTNKSTSLYLM